MKCLTPQVGSEMLIAIYNSDSNGMPSTLKAQGTMDLNTTYRISAGLIAEIGQDLAFIKGSLYYVGWFGNSSGTDATIQVIGATSLSTIAAGGGNNAMNYITAWKDASATSVTPPSTFGTDQTSADGCPFIGGEY